MTVELRPVDGQSDVFDVWAYGTPVGAVSLGLSGSVARVAVRVDVAPTMQEGLVAVIMAVVQRSIDVGATDVEFHGTSLLLRHEARRLGFRGPLHAPLQARAADVAVPVTTDADDAGGGPDDRARWLAVALDDVGVMATPARRARPLGRLAKRLAGGVGNPLELVCEWTPGRSFTISVPDRPDLMPEPIALAATTTANVFHRFSDFAAAVAVVRFDHGQYGLKEGHYAGVAAGSDPSIYLAVDFVAAEDALATLRSNERGEGTITPGAPAAYTPVEAVVAHELWHRIEFVFEARHYRSSLDFRRQLGEALGVDTLEHALKGGAASAPPPWQAAHRRLIDEVSAYATTNVREATAEMFKLWWCRGETCSAIVARFGELLDVYFPN
jgi:hypothetical protein